MREHWVKVQQDFRSSPEAVFGHLAEHENLGPIFGAKITRVCDGRTERNGVGSKRLVKIGPAGAVEETVTEFEPNDLIEYRVTRGGPLKGHVGIMRFSALPGGGTHLDYRIRVASNIPGVAPVLQKLLTRGITKGLSQLDSKLG